jgi:chemotaxis signal transduction protein
MADAELQQEHVSHIGWVSIGEFQFAIDVAHLFRALKSGVPLVALPRRQGPVAGLLETTEGVLPVVDLRLWLSLPGEKSAEDVISDGAESMVLHLRDSSRQIGVLVTRVHGVQTIPDGAVKRVHHHSAKEEIFDQLVQWDGLPHTLPLLDSHKLLDLLQIWLDEDEHRQHSESALQQGSAQSKGVVLATGHRQIWLDAHYVRELIPAKQILGPQAQQLHNWAVLRWRELPVPLVSSYATTEARHAGYVAMIGLDSGEMLGLLVDQLVCLGEWHASGRVSDAGNDEPDTADAELFPEVMLDSQEKPVYFLDIPELFRRHPEAKLTVGATETSALKMQQVGRRNPVPYIIFDADGVFAIGADRIQEIIALDHAPDEDGIQWRGRWIPFVPLADWYPLPRNRDVQTEKLAILSGHGNEVMAYGIHSLRMMVPAGRGRFHVWPGKADQGQILEVPANGSYTMATVVNWSRQEQQIADTAEAT